MLDFNAQTNPTHQSRERLADLVELIEQWASDKEILTKATPATQTLKLAEEAGEVAAAIARNKHDEAMDGIGDVFVVITILAKLIGVSVQDCVELAYEQISKRTGQLVNGVFIKSTEQIVEEGVK